MCATTSGTTHSAFFVAAVLSALMGMGAYWGDQHVQAQNRLAEPVLTTATFVNANCISIGGAKGSRPSLRLRYFYEPLDATSLRNSKFDASNIVGFDTMDECKKQLALTLIERKSTTIWYERTEPSKARFSLRTPNSSVFLWIFLPLAFLFAAIGLVLRKLAARQNPNKKFRKRKL